MSEAVTIRREPTQARAKARVERILAAASELIAETGSDAVRMADIASRAGVPIGSLYQYFPDKASMLRMLGLRFMERVRDGLRLTFSEIGSRDEALSRFDEALQGYYSIFLDEPVVRDVWSGMQSDKEMQALDIEDSRANAEIVVAALKPLVARRDHARLETTAFLRRFSRLLALPA
nr:TetR/AcrR family transcriptional regulator [Aerococcus tenax]